jgi:phosphonate transport system substrate-binding protein
MPHKRFITLLLVVLVIFTGCKQEKKKSNESQTGNVTPTSPVTPAGELVLADVADDPARILRFFQPLADYLAAHLGDYDIGVGVVRVAPDLQTMAQWLGNGEVDLYFDSLYPIMIVSEASGATPVLRRWRGGNSEYHTVFFALEESGFTSIEDLQGHVIAFDNEFSTSGYMVPVAYLIEAGLKVVEKPSTDAEVAPDEIGYVFSSDDDNTIQWVISGKVAAGVTDNLNYERAIPEETRNTLTILAETEDFPRQLVLISPALPTEQRAAIITLLKGMDEDPTAAEALSAFDTTQFDEFPEGPAAALNRMRELYNLVQNSQNAEQ